MDRQNVVAMATEKDNSLRRFEESTHKYRIYIYIYNSVSVKDEEKKKESLFAL